MHPRSFAEHSPDKAAIIMADTEELITFGELEEQANKGAHLLRELGIRNGDTIAFWLKNTPDYLTLYWTGQRAGVFMVPIPTHLTADEAAYIINDSGAKLLITSAEVSASHDLNKQLTELSPGIEHVFTSGLSIEGINRWEDASAHMPSIPIADEQAGFHLSYSSGTTGRPKGIKLPYVGGPATQPNIWVDRNKRRYDIGEQSIYLCPAPLYHVAPLLYSVTTHRVGGTVIILQKFSPEKALSAIEKYRVTYTQMVPTMFVRMLRMPEKERLAYDTSSLTHVTHAAAPCPVEVKHQMMEWLGEIIHEHYAGSEANGSTSITPKEWLERPGSVGRADRGVLHICNEEGDELAPGEDGLIYFEGASNFEYLNDPEKTKNARHPAHQDWTTLGDIGHVDDEGYLYLTDRKSFVIISGGVNIYPQETENVLAQHPKVADVAVVGVPNEDLGEEVKAIVQPLDWEDAGNPLSEELIEFCKSQLSSVKCPKSIDFDQQLPRADNGKLFKKALRARYWDKTST